MAISEESELGGGTGSKPSLVEMGGLFLKLGAIGFGGGVAMIALMEDEFVKRRRCIETEEFLHGVALGQILGSFPVNAALFLGYRLHGFWGALLASTLFLIPSLVAVVVLAWVYFQFHQIPSLQGVLAGLAPVVIGVILAAAWSMGRKALGSKVGLGIALGALLGSLTHVHPVALLVSSGILGLVLRLPPKVPAIAKPKAETSSLWLWPLAMQTWPHSLLATVSATPPTVSWLTLGLTFLKVGFVFFGGGFVLIPVLKHLLIDHLHWLTQQEFVDGVAMSQLTPGPIAVIATFVGFRLAGLGGAAIATLGLFLPSIVLMFGLSIYYQRARHLRPVQHFLAGVNPAVVGMIVSAAVNLAPSVFWGQSLVRTAVNGGLLTLTLFWMVQRKGHPAMALAVGAVTGGLLGWLLPA